MFVFILLIGVFGLFMASLVALVMDMISPKKNNNRPSDEKLPKLGKFSFIFNLFALLLLVLVSFMYVY